jgi:fatty-acyl-CoA synthase
MQDGPLLISGILRHGQRVYGDSEVITVEPGGDRMSTFSQVAGRAERLAAALRRLGVGDGDRVATFAWNDQEHLEAYLAVPSMGAVLHTLNIRLFPEQLAYVVNHAEDKVVIVDASVAPLLAKVRDQCPTIEHIIVVGEGDSTGLGETLPYEEVIGAEEIGYDWPELDERQAAAMCYTSGTTGNPKGVVYSHRSTWLHSFAGTSANALGATERDRVLVIVPMFHANAWGMPYTAFLAGTDLILPERFLQAEPLARMFAELKPTLSLGVPTIPAALQPVARCRHDDIAHDHGRRLGRAPHTDRGLPGPVRGGDDPGLGHDGDEPGVRHGLCAQRSGGRPGDGLAGEDGTDPGRCRDQGGGRGRFGVAG